MVKKILMLVAIIGMISIQYSIFAQTSTTKSKVIQRTNTTSPQVPALKSRPAKATKFDPLKYEFITGSMELGAYSTLYISVVNTRNKGDEYVQIEVHAAVVSGASPSPKLLKRSALIKLAPQNIFVFKHYRRKDGTDGNLHEHWVKIIASSEYLVPKVIHHSMPDHTQPSLIRAEYLPGDFAVYTRYPFKRVR